MPRINTYSDNASIENDDKVLTYDTQAAATNITAFSTIWNWIVSKLHALSSSSAALTPSTDRVLMDKNGTMTRVEPAAVAKYGIETYNGSTIAGSAQTVKSALDTLNSKLLASEETLTYTYNNKSVDIVFRYNATTVTVLMNKEDESMNIPTSWANIGTLTKIKPERNIYLPFVSSNGYTGAIRIFPDGGTRIIGNSTNPMWLQTSATALL